VRVLAIDTSTPRGSVAVADDAELLGEVRLCSEDPYSVRLLPAVQFLLEGLGLASGGLDGFAVTTGPGSFTGLRVGMSTIQGLALGAGRPCLGVSSLDVLAARLSGHSPHLAVMMDAFRGEVFAALYDARARPLGEPRVALPEEFLTAVPAGSAFLGDGALRYRQQVEEACPGAVFPQRSLFLAGTLARLAAPRLAAGEGAGPESLRPLYLRRADIRKEGA
jgi:tRNA threonylcarbamoyladenosine biosynthesis protein TsaB